MERTEVFDKIWEAYEGGQALPACAWCSRVRIGEEWIEPENGTLSTIDERMTLSHTICPGCAEAPLVPAISQS